jgi:hypothetical protein
VTARAHTGKQVILRRWPDRARLVVAAIRHIHGVLVPIVPETGSLREDVLTVLPGVIQSILTNAAARGELTRADLPARVVSLPVDLVRYERCGRPANGSGRRARRWPTSRPSWRPSSTTSSCPWCRRWPVRPDLYRPTPIDTGPCTEKA